MKEFEPTRQPQWKPVPQRDYLAEAFDIINGKPGDGRTLLRLPEREHLLALGRVIDQLSNLHAEVIR